MRALFASKFLFTAFAPAAIAALVVLAAIVQPCPAHAQTPPGGDMPVEYQGFAFGTPVSDLLAAGMVLSRQEFVRNEMYGDYTVDFYSRAGAAPTFAGVALVSEEFGVVDGQLQHVLLKAKGKEAYEAFVAQAAAVYGMEEETPFSTPEYEDCVKVHRIIRRDQVETHSWAWGVSQSDYIFAAVRVSYDEPQHWAYYFVGWPD